MKKIKKILITGSAGFIGMHTSLKFLEAGYYVLGIDNLNSYYDKNLKLKRLQLLKHYKKFKFIKLDISKIDKLKKAFKHFKPHYVINLAAQAGVRYSKTNPLEYTKSNLVGFSNILECSKIFKIKHLIVASSSSVYGDSKKFPLNEDEKLNTPLSFYAATKLSNELMAHSFSNIHKLPITVLRFFTVYGPWGRPDMSLFLFTDSIKNNKKIKLFNKGNMVRDFTYIDDAVSPILKLIKKIPKKKKNLSSSIPFRILNIGRNNPVKLKNYIKEIEKNLKKTAKKIKLPMQDGEMKYTHADLSKINQLIAFKPKTKISDGIKKFINWHNKFYKK